MRCYFGIFHWPNLRLLAKNVSKFGQRNLLKNQLQSVPKIIYGQVLEMCGILALFKTPWKEQGRKLLGTIHTRGPDDAQLLDLQEATLGHTRLSIIDLAGGSQPMQAGDLYIVFNGEIYNYKELRRELEKEGFHFKTHSDTEVLLHGFAAWQEKLLLKLDGMFAFCLFDAKKRGVFFARDRLGIKPLFYSTKVGLILSSSLKTFFEIESFPRSLNFEALRDYLAFQTVLAPHTFVQEVHQLPPATYAFYDLQTQALSTKQYWHLPLQESGPSFDECVELTDQALRESVRRQLCSDVPLGAFLSGGIDSSLVVHYMHEAGIRPIKTFSMRIPGDLDESHYAKTISALYGTEHHVIEAPEMDAEAFLKAIDHLDQPLADPAYILTQLLSKKTKQHVTVALSGDGGDELFGGYARFLQEEAHFPDTPTKRLLRALLQYKMAPGSLLRRSLYGKELLFYRKVELGPWDISRKSMRRYLHEEALQKCAPEKTLQLWKDLCHPSMDSATLMRADLWTYLSENCLSKTDRASMASGLEVRVPFLGNPILDTVLKWPSHLHFQKGCKSILKTLSERHLPSSIYSRPKHGFSVPLAAYFENQWKDLIINHLENIEKIAPFLNADQVRNCFKTGSKRLSYTFLVLLLWLSKKTV